MSELEIIRELISTAGGGGVFLTLFLMWKLGLFNGRHKDLEANMAELKEYFNHDTTAHHEKTHEKLDKLNNTLVDLSYSIKNIHENGVPCKEKK